MRVISSNDNIAPLRREQVCMGGGVVTGLILQGSLSLYSCYMSNKLFQDIYNLILGKNMFIKDFNTAFGTWRTQYWPKDHIFPQKCNLLLRMPSFLFYRLEKGKTIYILYTMVLIPAMQFTLYCCRYCHICLQYNIYIYT